MIRKKARGREYSLLTRNMFRECLFLTLGGFLIQFNDVTAVEEILPKDAPHDLQTPEPSVEVSPLHHIGENPKDLDSVRVKHSAPTDDTGIPTLSVPQIYYDWPVFPFFNPNSYFNPYYNLVSSSYFKNIFDQYKTYLEIVKQRQNLMTTYSECSTSESDKCEKVDQLDEPANPKAPNYWNWGFGEPEVTYVTSDSFFAEVNRLKSSIEKLTLRQNMLYEYVKCSCPSKTECSASIKPVLDIAFSSNENHTRHLIHNLFIPANSYYNPNNFFQTLGSFFSQIPSWFNFNFNPLTSFFNYYKPTPPVFPASTNPIFPLISSFPSEAQTSNGYLSTISSGSSSTSSSSSSYSPSSEPEQQVSSGTSPALSSSTSYSSPSGSGQQFSSGYGSSYSSSSGSGQLSSGYGSSYSSSSGPGHHVSSGYVSSSGGGGPNKEQHFVTSSGENVHISTSPDGNSVSVSSVSPGRRRRSTQGLINPAQVGIQAAQEGIQAGIQAANAADQLSAQAGTAAAQQGPNKEQHFVTSSGEDIHISTSPNGNSVSVSSISPGRSLRSPQGLLNPAQIGIQAAQEGIQAGIQAANAADQLSAQAGAAAAQQGPNKEQHFVTSSGEDIHISTSPDGNSVSVSSISPGRSRRSPQGLINPAQVGIQAAQAGIQAGIQAANAAGQLSAQAGAAAAQQGLYAANAGIAAGQLGAQAGAAAAQQGLYAANAAGQLGAQAGAAAAQQGLYAANAGIAAGLYGSRVPY